MNSLNGTGVQFSGGGSGITSSEIADAGAAFPALAQAETAAAQREAIGAVYPTIVFPSGKHVFGDIPANWNTADNSMTGLVIGNGVTSIGVGAFSSIDGDGIHFIPLTIPDSVTSIGSNAFDNSYVFDGPLTIPDSVTTIGDYAFFSDIHLGRQLTLGNSVTSIGVGAFDGCTSFTGELMIPESVVSIGSRAFSATDFSSATIPASVTSVGSDVFYFCFSLLTLNAYVAKSVLDGNGQLNESVITTIHARASDATWAAGPGQTIGGKSGITVIKDL